MVEWAGSVPTPLLFLSVISVHELELGVQLAERRDGPKGRLLRAWLDDSVIPGFSERILPVDVTVARRAAAFHVPDPAPVRAAFIGAAAAAGGQVAAVADAEVHQARPVASTAVSAACCAHR